MNSFSSLPEFEKEFKRLFKKYRTLDDDLEKFKKVLKNWSIGLGKNFTIVHSTETVKIIKARMACRALYDRSLRVIYAYVEQEKKIEFIEIYDKDDKKKEKRERIKKYRKNLKLA